MRHYTRAVIETPSINHRVIVLEISGAGNGLRSALYGVPEGLGHFDRITECFCGAADRFTTGGQSIFWGDGVEQVGEVQLIEIARSESEDRRDASRSATRSLPATSWTSR